MSYLLLNSIRLSGKNKEKSRNKQDKQNTPQNATKRYGRGFKNPEAIVEILENIITYNNPILYPR